MGWLNRRRNPDIREGKAVAAARHGSVLTVDPYSFQASHRRLAWMLRMSVGYSVISTVAVIVLAQSISVLVPLKEPVPMLIRDDPAENRTYRIEPLRRDVDGFDIVLEQFARRYVKILLEIDGATQALRMREVTRKSDARYWETFERERGAFIRRGIEKGLVREIRIESATLVASWGGTWKYAVDLLQRDRWTREPNIKGQAEERKLRAYLEIGQRRQEDVPERDIFENPFGFTVLELSLKEKG